MIAAVAAAAAAALAGGEDVDACTAFVDPRPEDRQTRMNMLYNDLDATSVSDKGTTDGRGRMVGADRS